MVAEIYFAVRHKRGVSVKGRVLLARTWPHPDANDPGLVNLYHMLRRWCTPERPYSLVRISAGGIPVEKRSDREGYFEIDLAVAESPDADLLIELPESEVSEPAHWSINPLSENSRCLVLSDVDDTVLVTHAGKILTMIATTLLGNALTRQLFPGAVELYTALRHGPDPSSEEQNPLAYVTSSPYNLHGLLELVFTENGLPLGPFFMTDWGLDEDRWLIRSHRDHKLDAIRSALAWFPDKSTILIGDSSQHDVPIYIDAALEHPGRIAMILIHKVSHEARITTLGAETTRLADSATVFHFFADHAEAATLLAAAGWISEAQCAEVVVAATAEKPSLAERVAERLHLDPPSDSTPSDGK